MISVLQWEDIKANYSGGATILGNGSSMAISSQFGYGSLFDEAKRKGFISPSVQGVFDKFDVTDFELVLRRLWQAKQVNDALGIEHGLVEESYQQVRSALIETIRATHVTYEDAEPHLEHIYTFLKQFKTVISLNYDLIVYWAAMYGNRKLGRWFKDCFVPNFFSDDWDTYREPYGADGATLYFYPHGNLVLKRYGFSSAKKIIAGSEKNLLESILSKWEEQDLAPVFVCEGTKELKENSIASCDYLEKIYYEVMPNLESTLVIFGWGIWEQDEHLLKQISKAKPTKVAVSVYQNDQTYMGRVHKQLSDIGVTDIVFFDSESSGVWNQPSTEYIEAQEADAEALHEAVRYVLKSKG
ncbi:MAG: hypothetical protein ACI88H_000464 [Cocleimonas sp.]|jgi:hypothetical protein